ncbi:hypothetical protein PKB_1428 [Pseudomonas knackmussii B13]|uniref:Uncharacterized protein n=1 Tax=Pseudomonas knackmussii (strain DSM 6978 / CCUG 54928 / LMG 23759 / B13) TaxID=1301098 RepID=A0A024HCJ4_PSEKB|nr:transporter substrate-binding domain-containing protein [Pseudomonas knackmussii]CDF82790.1 hypothetical protein PKB_1428 [Pseudomonas knackmussii B13]
MLRSAIASLLCTAALGAVAEPLRLGGDDWCPYLCPETPNKPGYLVEGLRHLLPETPEVQSLPWSRALQMARDGQLDGVIGAYAEEAEGLLIGREPIGWVEMRFYTRADSAWQYRGPASLDSLKIGLVQGYSYGPQLDAWRDSHLDAPEQVQVLSGERVLERNLQKLLLGRIDVLVEDHRIVDRYLHRQHLDKQVRSAGGLPHKRPMYVALSPHLKDAAARLEALDQGLRRMRESGAWEPLMRGYLVSVD